MTKHDKAADDSSRRDFLKAMTVLPVAAFLGDQARTRDAQQPSTSASTATAKKKFVAIQIGARSFVDEGVDQVLDTLQQKARANVLMPAVFTYGRGLAGRQV